MRHVVFLFILILNSLASAAPPALDQVSNKEIAAPILIKSGTDEAQVGLFTVEPSVQKENALTLIREALHEMEAQEQKKAQKDGVFLNTTRRFTPESLTFFIAIGGVTFNSMWIKSHGDPLAMERHILSLKDPVAHLSFYTFMMTQGFYMDFFSKRLGKKVMDETTRRQMMRRLTYQGMAVGSLFSSIAADLGQSVKMCVDSWMLGKTDEASLESCNQAWVNWTARGKFNQYFPQIISLWATQAAVGAVEGAAGWGFNKITVTTFAKNILSKDYLVKTAYKITGADLVLTFSGGGLALKGIKLAGKVTRFSLFVGVDHLLSNYTYRPINNLLKPMFFDFDAMAINNLWYEADLGNWDQGKMKNPKSIEKFEKEIENYTNQMQQWRDHLNQDAETDLAGWMEMTKEILNQIDYSYKYYKGFADNLFETLSIDQQIKNNELAATAADNISRYPLRLLPFYGVSTGPYKPVSGQIEDLYITSPNEIEKRQKEHILNVANQFKEVLPALKDADLEKMKSILDKLLSQNNLKMSSGLNDINQVLLSGESRDEKNKIIFYSVEFYRLLKKFKNFLGNPQPVVYPFAGYSQAFAANSLFHFTEAAADFSKWSLYKKYSFNKEADLMMYKIICGKSTAGFDKVSLAGVNFLSPQFDPPTLLNQTNDKDLDFFCRHQKNTNNLYSTKIGNKTLQEYVLAHLDYSAIGDYRNKKKNNTFENWWQKTAKEPLNIEFKNFDNQFQKLFQVAYDNFFDHRSFYKFFVDGLNLSLYLPKSLQATLKTETDLYLQILSRTLMDNSGIPEKKLNNLNYLEYSRKSSEDSNYLPIYGQTQPEIIRLRLLLDAYYVYIMHSQVNFDQYIAHSKKIDTAINDILVRVQLKKVVLTSAGSEQSEDLSAPASASGSENSEKSYEVIKVQNPTFKQRMAVAAVKGLRQVESEIRRFIRMRIVLSQSLELDTKEFMADWNNANTTENKNLPKKTNPFGGSR